MEFMGSVINAFAKMALVQDGMARVLEGPKYYFGGLWRLVNDKPIFLWGQAIAFKVLITIVPVVFLSVAVLGQILKQERPFAIVADFIREFLPGYRSEQLIAALDQLQGASGTLTMIGVAGLLFFAMTLFSTLRVVVSSVFQEEWHETRSIVGGYAFDLRMAGQVGLLFLLTISLTTGLRFLDNAGYETLVEILRRVNLDNVWFEEGYRGLFRLVFYVLPFLLSIAMFFQLFYFIPKPHPPPRSAVVGAIAAAFLWEVAKLAFSFYATRVGRFERYESAGDAALGSIGQTFGLILAFVFWVYYSGVVLCIGASVALLNEKRHRMKRKRILTADTEEARPPAAPAPAGDLEPAPVEAEGGRAE